MFDFAGRLLRGGLEKTEANAVQRKHDIPTKAREAREEKSKTKKVPHEAREQGSYRISICTGAGRGVLHG